MMTAELEFIRMLRSFGVTPNSETRRDLLVATMKVSKLADECRWPKLIKVALGLVETLQDVQPISARVIPLAQVALDLAVALAGDVGELRAPEFPKAK